MLGIVDSVVHSVSGLPAGTQTTWQNTDLAYDYAIGGLPFLSAASPQFPITRKTADYIKQQIDQSTDPGEQTLVTWWLRSQSSFHAGTGIIYEEPQPGSATDTTQYRFQESAGVDVWKAGKVKLLRSAPQDLTATNPIAMGALTSAGEDCYFQADGSTLTRSVVGSSSAVSWGGTGTILSLAQDGTNYYAADATGIYKGTLAGGAGTKIWNTGTTPVVIKWVKSRLMAAIGASIYELAGTGPALPTPVYTHPNPNWVWTSIAESPAAIYAAGYAGSSSQIFMFTLDTSGSVPTLTSGIPAAELPDGEVIHCIYGYLGSYVAIGTNKGCRIADVQADGSLQYGPLSVDFSILGASGDCLSIVGVDRFLYGSLPNGIGGNSGLWRIDLGTALGFKQFAYATDLQAHVSGAVNSVTLYADLLVFSVAGHGTYVQSDSQLEATGYLKTGNIRFHMLEPKLFKYVRVRSEPLTAGSIAITVNDHADNPTSLVTYTAGLANDPLDEVAYPVSLGQQEWTSLTITLGRDAGDDTAGPTVTSYQVKALPAQKRQRTIVLPLLCYDSEADAQGAKHGHEGQALQRLIALEAVEEAGDIVLYQDLTRNGEGQRLVIVDSLQFIQQDPPKLAARASGWGGIIMATLRAVT